MYLLLIDYREGDFIKRLSEYTFIENEIIKNVSINGIEVCFKITNLTIGDFIIENDEGVNVVIERKSVQDLCSSIIDGRFREQKQRLMDSVNDESKIVYMIEGNGEKSVHLSKSIIDGSILNLVFKHNYKVIQTNTKLDTFNMVLLLYKKIRNSDFEKVMKPVTMKVIKKSDNIRSSKILNQLCLIPGVSNTVAETIINKMDIGDDRSTCTIKTLIDFYNQLSSENERELFFANVSINAKRKIGKALSKKIYEYFCKE
jgi:crossover junction endonuclease MUS81